MKKIILILLSLLLLLVIFNKVVFSKIIIFSISKWIERDFLVKKIDINYSNEIIVLNFVEIRNKDKFYYKNIFESDKIQIEYNFKSIFTDLVKIEYLFLENSRVFLEFYDKNNEIIDDNIGIVEKYVSDYTPKKYPKKKKDKNFLIIKAELKNSKAFIKTLNNKKKIEINLSDMNFYKVANKKELQHYKEVFKVILNDLFFRVPDKKLKNLIKNTYKL